MSTQADIDKAAADSKEAASIMKAFAKGDAETQVDNGLPDGIPSLAKFIAEKDAEFTAGLGNMLDEATSRAESAADNAEEDAAASHTNAQQTTADKAQTTGDRVQTGIDRAFAEAASLASGGPLAFFQSYDADSPSMSDALSGLADGIYEILADETHDGAATRYTVDAHVATYQTTLEAVASGSNLTPTAGWDDVPQLIGRGSAGANAQAQAAANRFAYLESPAGGAKVGLADAGNYYTDKNVEGALQEVGLVKNAIVYAESHGVVPSSPDIHDALKTAIMAASGKTVLVNKNSYDLGQLLTLTDTDVNNCVVDFQGSDIYFHGKRTVGQEYNWHWGAISLHGTYTGTTVRASINTDTIVGDNAFTFGTNMSSPDFAKFAVGDFWHVVSNPAAAGWSDYDTIIATDPEDSGNVTGLQNHVVNKMLEVAHLDAGTRTVYFAYRQGFAIPSGTPISFYKVLPVKNVVIKNVGSIIYRGDYVSGSPTYTGSDADKAEASSGVGMLYTVDCKVDGFNYVRNPKQAVHAGYSIRPKLDNVHVSDPLEVNSGGYAVQFAFSIYGVASLIHSERARHTIDWTGSAYCAAFMSSGVNTQNVDYNTHGAFEHDIALNGSSGAVQLCGSSTRFGLTTARFTIRKHTGTSLSSPRFGAEPSSSPNYGNTITAYVSDLTIEDSSFISTMDLNCDGLQIRGLTASRQLMRLYNFSQNSKRGNYIAGAEINAGAGFFAQINEQKTPTGAWSSGVAATANTTIYTNGTSVYLALTTGTTGATAPTHVIGQVSDGGVTWQFLRRTWATGQTQVRGQFATNSSGELYQAINNGTTGATEPTHVTGVASDGAVSWQWIGYASAHFKKSNLQGISTSSFTGRGSLTLEDCDAASTSASTTAITAALDKLSMIRGTWSGLPINFGASYDQELSVRDTDVSNGSRPNTVSLFASTKTSGNMEIILFPKKSTHVTTGRHLTISNATTGATTRVRIGHGAWFKAGSILVDSGCLGASGYYISDNVIYDGTTKTLPTATTNVVIGAEINL